MRLVKVIGTIVVIFLLLINIGMLESKGTRCHEHAEIMQKWLPWYRY